MRRRWLVTGCVAALIAGCAGPASAGRLAASPATYLLGIDQLISPDFAYVATPHPLSAADTAAAGGAGAAQLTGAGFVGAATEEFFRDAPDLAVLNGPAQIDDTVRAFSSQTGAASVYRTDVGLLDAVQGSTAVSTGALGDAAHATTRTASAPSGTIVVQITIEWRVDNLLDVLVVRGRYGGIRIDDALLLAHRETVSELGLSTPTPAVPATTAGS